MKIRNGYVSNSSSSSFCIYGTSMDFDELMEKVKKFFSLTDEELERLEELEDEDYEIIELLQEKTDLEILYSSEAETVWIGRSWSSIEDDETGLQFKESVKKEMTEKFGPDIEYDTYEEELYS